MQSRESYPWWVKAGLWGLSSRGEVQAFVWLSLALALGCVAWAVLKGDPRLYVGVIFVLAAPMYWAVIRWVDRHGSWTGLTRW